MLEILQWILVVPWGSYTNPRKPVKTANPTSICYLLFSGFPGLQGRGSVDFLPLSYIIQSQGSRYGSLNSHGFVCQLKQRDSHFRHG